MERRKFIKYATASLATPFLFKGQLINAMSNSEAMELLSTYNPGRKLILIQLDGGNDGLNMLIPISQYDNLVKARENILVPQNKILKITNETGLHPSMPELRGMYLDGKVQFIQGVGYPNPNLSHFRSKDIIMSASDSKTVLNTGWAGRMLSGPYADYPNGYPNLKNPHPIALTIGSTSSETCQGNFANYSSVLKNLSSAYTSNSENTIFPNTPFGNELKFVSNMMEKTESYLSVIKESAAKAKNLSVLYPESGKNSLADKLKLVANLIAGGLQTQIYVVSLGGWDTHSAQVSNDPDKLSGIHPTLLSNLSIAISAFQDDLKLLNKADDVMGFVYTEFGRRIKSNGSLGTDHGTSWPAIIFGSKVNPGIIGQNPIIPNEVGKSDNLSVQNDFRSIYSSFYKQWFSLSEKETEQILGAKFPEIQLLTKSTNVNTTISGINSSLKLWPNPIKSAAQLIFETKNELVQIRVYTIDGILVENIHRRRYSEGTYNLQIELGHLKNGNYILSVQKNNSNQSLKFSKY